MLSLAGHFLLAAVVSFVPRPALRPLPRVISARLVTMEPIPASKRFRSVSPEKTSVTAKPAPSAPAPVPVAKKVLLPKHPKPIRKQELKVRRRPRPKELAYEDALAALRSDLNEPEVSNPPAAATAAKENHEDLSLPLQKSGAQVSSEVAAWIGKTQRHLRKEWIVPPQFLNRALVTELTVRLSAAGEVLGRPKVVRSSGDPFWDDNTVRALQRASPLPPPPESGEWPFVFTPQ